MRFGKIFLFGVFIFLGVFGSAEEGCCELTVDQTSCLFVEESECSSGANFFPSPCSATTFCSQGCCYNPVTQAFFAGASSQDCDDGMIWDSDPNCNIEGLEEGCCVLEDRVEYVTQGQCELYTPAGTGSVDWRSGLSLSECTILAHSGDYGACVFSDGDCDFIKGEDCGSRGGEFVLDALCTAEELNTICEPTNQTTCVDWADQVYFIDSCNNPANIYDSTAGDYQAYWENVIESDDSCNAGASDGNANSPSCGNCERFSGGFCSPAAPDNFEPDSGNNYCKGTSCEHDGVIYENGQSWCVYDGVIGNGDDIVGSKHWLYNCNFGEIGIEGCGSYRNKICVQQNTEVDEVIVNVEASCVNNDWSYCVDLNKDLSSAEDKEEAYADCVNAPQCKIEQIDIDEWFNISGCVPKFPGGRGFSEDAIESTTEDCEVANLQCRVYPMIYPVSDDCEKPEFAIKMNDFCRKLGDCGGEVNILGDYENNFEIAWRYENRWDYPSWIPQSQISFLSNFSNPIQGQYAGVGDWNLYSSPGIFSGGWFSFPNFLSWIANRSSEGQETPNPEGKLLNVLGDQGSVWKRVHFECLPWQPPVGGDNCEECNFDSEKSCSKYRCESLGANCEIINRGSDYELCINNASADVTPPILSPQQDAISPDEKYSDVTANGFRISSRNARCLEPYTPLTFGIETDRPTICKYSEELDDFDDMALIGVNYYVYDHSMPYPVLDPSAGESQGFNYSEEQTIYVKCQDRNGRENVGNNGFYVIDMCIQEGEDRRAPMVTSSVPESESLVSFDLTEMPITITTNEFSTCKWSLNDSDYSAMENDFDCIDSFESPSSAYGYVCMATFPVNGFENEYFIRCGDQPWFERNASLGTRNYNQESFKLVLRKPETRINITSILPSEDFIIGTDAVTVDIKVGTTGGGSEHKCRFSFGGYDSLFGILTNSGGNTHEIQLSLNVGEHEIYIGCEDEVGDDVHGMVSFEIEKDDLAPRIARVWNEAGTIHVITTEESECKYSGLGCKFDWETADSAGTDEEHIFSTVPGRMYHIKCMDEFGNVPRSCSISVIGV